MILKTIHGHIFRILKRITPLRRIHYECYGMFIRPCNRLHPFILGIILAPVVSSHSTTSHDLSDKKPPPPPGVSVRLPSRSCRSPEEDASSKTLPVNQVTYSIQGSSNAHFSYHLIWGQPLMIKKRPLTIPVLQSKWLLQEISDCMKMGLVHNKCQILGGRKCNTYRYIPTNGYL